MVAADIALVFLPHLVTVASHIHFATEDGLEGFLALFLQFLVGAVDDIEKFFDAKHHTVVGDSHTALTVGYCFVNQSFDRRLTIEDGIVCMNV